MSTNLNLVVYTDDEGNRVDKYFEDGVSEYEFFSYISYLECFSDCYPVDIKEIWWHGEPWCFCGWQPNMKYEFYSVEDPEQRWVGWFDEWEH